MKIFAIVLAAVALSPAAIAQSTVEHLSQSELLQKAEALKADAAAHDGSAAVKLSEYPNHFTMISLREKDGGAEVHQKYADIFYVMQGDATLITGGTVVNPKEASAGEIRGTAVEGGAQVALHQGDFVHIPAGVPHRLMLSGNPPFIYFVIKVAEK